MEREVGGNDDVNEKSTRAKKQKKRKRGRKAERGAVGNEREEDLRMY